MTESTSSQPHDDLVERLVAECLERISHGDDDPLEALCATHPTHADELRRRHAGLVQMGLWSRSDNNEPLQIGNFRLLRELGRGGMGVVHLAHQSEPIRRLAALKVTANRASEQALERFHAERQALARLVHPNIAQVLEAGATPEGQPWYAMEFVDGQPITAYCNDGNLELEARLELFLQLCDAVQFAHQHSVLHRDLKPGNVLVCERGGKPLVKVIDFGLAKALEDPFTDAHDLTEDGQILGTPEYMSPEQAMPTAAGVDTRTDVYALGTMLYELCCGALPFEFVALRKQGFTALQYAVCELEPPRVSERLTQLGEIGEAFAQHANTTADSLARRLRGDLDAIAQKALAKDRERRYAAVSELAADVRRHLRHEPVLATPPSTLYQLQKFVRRHRAGVAFAATLVVGLVVALVVVTDLLITNTESLARFDTLAIARDLDKLEARLGGDLWPATPDRLGVLRDAYAKAQQIVGALPECQRQLAALEALATEQELERRDDYLYSQLEPLIERLEAASAEGGIIDELANRRDWAAGLEELTVTSEDAQKRWREAIATIADESQCPAYKGLVIVPQLGLLPLGRDRHSELYEFAYPQPGMQLPKRRLRKWAVADNTCMILVLIPGGKAQLGLGWPDNRLHKDVEPDPYEYAAPSDGSQGGKPVVCELQPFLLSKYETTLGQWIGIMGENPSTWYGQERWKDHGFTLRHPADTISAVMADEAVRRLALRLPTAAQFEHAARGFVDAPWWTGFGPTGWYFKENLPDASLSRPLQEYECDAGHVDGYARTAPVDSKVANPFGLFHVLGNLREWTRDPAYLYRDALPRAGDGALDSVDGQELSARQRFIMGGSWMTAWVISRSTKRSALPADQRARSFGMRPARTLERQ